MYQFLPIGTSYTLERPAIKCSLSSGSFLHNLQVGSIAYWLKHDLLACNIYEPVNIFTFNSALLLTLFSYILRNQASSDHDHFG